MSPWKVILATMVIFVCGVVTGALVVNALRPHAPQQRTGGLSFGMPGQQAVTSLMHEIKHAGIELTPEQSNQVVKITLDSQAVSYAIRTNYAPQLRAVAKKAHDAISGVLTGDQQIKWEAFQNEDEQRRGPRGGGMGRRRGGGTNGTNTNGSPMDERSRDNWVRRNPSTNAATNAP